MEPPSRVTSEGGNEQNTHHCPVDNNTETTLPYPEGMASKSFIMPGGIIIRHAYVVTPITSERFQ